MLKLRIATALVLITIVVLAVNLLNVYYFAALAAVFFSMAASEWASISGLNKISSRIYYVLTIGILMFLCFIFRDSVFMGVVIGIAVFWWLLAFMLVIGFQQKKITAVKSVLLKLFIGVLVLVPAWLSLVTLHNRHIDGASYVLFLFVLIWVADSAAYFTGRYCGKNKLADVVSPGKTWEGVFGAVIACTLTGLVFAWGTKMQGTDILTFLLVCLITVCGSILGDLMESLFKRQQRIKDSGRLLPGHGGVMDRIDSLTAAAPIFFAGLWSIKAIS